MTAVPPLLDAIGLDAPVTDAPVTTVEYDGDQARPLQDIPRTRLWARLEQVALAAFIAVPLLAVAASGVVLWGNGLSWLDEVLTTVFYAVSAPVQADSPTAAAQAPPSSAGSPSETTTQTGNSRLTR